MSENKINPVTIHDNVNGKITDYTLEFSCDSVRFSESKGFSLSDDAPLTLQEDIFYYAFRKNHPAVSRKEAREILIRCGGLTDELMERLVLLYTKPFEDIRATADSLKNAVSTVEF